jgi:hypothetical protein
MSRRRVSLAAAQIAVLAVAMLAVIEVVGSVIAGRPVRALATLPNGTRILHVPMSWCVVRGTPAAVAPNVTSEGTTVADTNTDAVMWRRHERPTDNVFLPQASLSLRSSINNSWGTLNFPRIDDPDTGVGQQGDVVATFNRTAELTALETSCEQEYARLGRAGIGITAVNVNLWLDSGGVYRGQTGLGGCSYSGPAGSPCSSDFFIFVADNRWFYPTVPNRNIANFGTPFADPLDLIVAHETGHALNLQHRNNTAQVMNPSTVDNNGDLRVDNSQLSTTDVSTLRATAQNVPGLEIDPPRAFVPGPLLAMRRFDGPRRQALPGHLDLAALTLALDRRTGSAQIAQRLWGLLPCRSLGAAEYDYFADLDNKPRTGAPPGALSRLGLSSTFRGADLVARTTVVGGRRTGREFRTCRSRVEAWIVSDGKVVRAPPSAFDARIKTMRIQVPHFPVNNQPVPRPDQVDVLNTIELSLRNERLPIRIRQRAPVRLFVQVFAGKKRADRFGGRFILEHPRFPHCFPTGTGTPGRAVRITFDGLRPNREIHALLGPNEVLRGVQANRNGSGRIRLPIPRGTRRGNHLVTIGHDGLALTADCTVTVR